MVKIKGKKINKLYKIYIFRFMLLLKKLPSFELDKNKSLHATEGK